MSFKFTVPEMIRAKPRATSRNAGLPNLGILNANPVEMIGRKWRLALPRGIEPLFSP